MKKFTQLMAASALLIGGSFAANAQVVQIQENPLTDGIVKARVANAENYETREVEGGKILTPKRTRTQAPAEEGNITAIVRHKYDEEKFVPYTTQIRNFSTGDEYWLYDNDSIVNLPAGTYDIITIYEQFEFIYEDGAIDNGVQRICVKEQVEFNEGTIVECSTDDCGVPVYFQVKNPQGEVLRQPTIKVNEDYTQETLDEGNILDMYVTNFLIHKESGAEIPILGKNLSSIWVHPTHTENNNESTNSVYISPLSDRFALGSVRLYFTRDYTTLNYVYLQGEYSENGIITNNPDNYALYKESIAQSPKGKESMGCNPYPLISISGFNKEGRKVDGWDIFLQSPLPENEIKYYVNNIVEGDLHITPAFRGGFIDAQFYDDFWEEYSFDNCYVYGPYVMQENNGTINYVNNGDIKFRRTTADDGSLVWNPAYPGSPILSYPTTQKEYSLNNCCPTQLNEIVEYSSYNRIYFNKFYGRAGEYNEFHMGVSKLVVKADNEVIEEFVGKNFYNCSHENFAGKAVDLVSTCDNILVDGVAGKNTTTIHVNYTQEEDLFVPTITMLDFVNAEGIMTDRFNTPQDGTIRFFAGELPNCYDALANVEVYYAPYNTDTWETITVEEDPDQFWLPGLGQFFSGSLADVNKVADNGWCDVKIKITDAAGNFQEQIISPAFYIEDVSAIESITSDSDATIVGYYDILGRKLNEPADGINIVRMSDGTAKKVVIEKK